jgi:hypothetical protein
MVLNHFGRLSLEKHAIFLSVDNQMMTHHKVAPGSPEAFAGQDINHQNALYQHEEKNQIYRRYTPFADNLMSLNGFYRLSAENHATFSPVDNPFMTHHTIARRPSQPVAPQYSPRVPLLESADLGSQADRILPIRRCSDRVLQIRSDRRLVHFHMTRLGVPQQHLLVVQVVRASLLLCIQKATGDTVEKDVEVVGLVDLAACAARLAVGHKRRGGLEVLEAGGTLHAYDAVVTKDMRVQVTGGDEGLPVGLLVTGYSLY